MTLYRCNVCNVFEYDPARGNSLTGVKPGTLVKDFPSGWKCPICNSDNSHLVPVPDRESAVRQKEEERYLGLWERPWDDLETTMADIHAMARTGESIIEPMRTGKPVISWDDILILGAQLAKIPECSGEPVKTRTVIGPEARHPLVIETPVYITHMSYGALSKEVKIALAQGSAAVKTAIGSGEGGILPEERERAFRYIFEYVPNRYSVTPENLQSSDAIEIKIGQSAEPGMGARLPAEKVTADIAKIRNFPEGADILSPACFPDIRTMDDLREKVTWLRDSSGGKPIGVKIAAGHLEEDLAAVLSAKPDFITIDGRPGATGAALKFIKAATSVPTIFALYRARKFLDRHNARSVSLVITGGLRVSSDFAKALALGADAVAIGTAALIACGCQQYRLCHTGLCPVGITTQTPALRSRLVPYISAKQLEHFLRCSTEELKDFARITGNRDVHALSIQDLITTNSEISNHTEIPHV